MWRELFCEVKFLFSVKVGRLAGNDDVDSGETLFWRFSLSRARDSGVQLLGKG
jgi:hypothetical protein